MACIVHPGRGERHETLLRKQEALERRIVEVSDSVPLRNDGTLYLLRGVQDVPSVVLAGETIPAWEIHVLKFYWRAGLDGDGHWAHDTVLVVRKERPRRIAGIRLDSRLALDRDEPLRFEEISSTPSLLTAMQSRLEASSRSAVVPGDALLDTLMGRLGPVPRNGRFRIDEWSGNVPDPLAFLAENRFEGPYLQLQAWDSAKERMRASFVLSVRRLPPLRVCALGFFDGEELTRGSLDDKEIGGLYEANMSRREIVERICSDERENLFLPWAIMFWGAGMSLVGLLLALELSRRTWGVLSLLGGALLLLWGGTF